MAADAGGRSVLDGRIYRVLEVFANLVYLNFLWLLACLPVVTIPVSTTAMFGIVREWVRGDEPPIARRFVSLFGENFRQGLIVGVIWALAGGSLLLDLYLIGRMGSLRAPLYVALLRCCPRLRLRLRLPLPGHGALRPEHEGHTQERAALPRSLAAGHGPVPARGGRRRLRDPHGAGRGPDLRQRHRLRGLLPLRK
ncbi:MAG: YesL family protein [Rubrobacter sp.]|nr:YesL family protein [Rubrobacter sp.]